MKKTISLLLTALSLILTLLPLPGESASRQQSNVFVGRGQVSRRGARGDRADRPQVYDDERASSDEDDRLKPMVGTPMLAEIETLERKCLNDVNRIRESHKVGRLELSLELLKVAREYSRRMAEENFFSHNDPEGLTVRERVDRAGIRWRMIGENLAYSNGYTNPVAASVTGWLDSPGHRRNMLDPDFQQTAIGVWISANGTVYFTEIFIK